MFNSRAIVLFDTRASHSFISSAFASALDLEVDCLGSMLTVDTLVGEFIDIFLEDLPGLLPIREIEFTIYLVLGTSGSSILPY